MEGRVWVVKVSRVSVTVRWFRVDVKWYLRYTPVVDNSRSSCLFWVICDVQTEAINCSLKVVIRAPKDVPVIHERLEGFANCCKRSMKEAAAEVSEGFIAGVLSSTY